MYIDVNALSSESQRSPDFSVSDLHWMVKTRVFDVVDWRVLEQISCSIIFRQRHRIPTLSYSDIVSVYPALQVTRRRSMATESVLGMR